MRHCVLGLVAGVLALAVGCRWLPPREEPLLLEELDEGPQAQPALMADNSRCFVCHMNYADEELTVTHQRANVGCTSCHGMCDDHCSDEAHLTPPDIMYPRGKINPACMKCHPAKDLQEAKEHQPLLADPDAANQMCTDCHGDHGLETRQVRWDKETGKLLPQDQATP